MKPRVLIFEDDDLLRSILNNLLDRHGYEVFAFSDPGMCPVSNSVNHICPFDHACADISISDVNMPTQSGLEFIKDQKQNGCKAKFCALMSGYWTDTDLQHAQELDCADFHFTSEENIATSCGLPGVKSHHERHLQLLEEFNHIAEKLDNGLKTMDEFIDFITDWFLGHTLHEDRKFFKKNS